MFAAAVLVQLGVLYAPRAADPAPGLPLDKVVHVALFAAVAWTGLRAGVPRRPLVALLLAHAVVSEVVQGTLLPHRSGDVRDALADAVGVLVGVLVAAFDVRGHRADG